MRNDENARKKISESLKRSYKEGRRKPVSFPGESNPFYGKRHSDITKKRISDTKVGNSPAWNKNTRGIMTAWNKGKKLPYPIWNKGLKGVQAGENHPCWIKDRTKVKVGERSLNDPLQKHWRKEVKDRDGWKCRISNHQCSGKLVAHHIFRWQKFPELRHEVNNGITLCHFHHPRKIIDEMRLSSFFIELVNSQKQNISH